MSRPSGWEDAIRVDVCRLEKGARVRAQHESKRNALQAEIDAMVWPDPQLTERERSAIEARVKAAVMNCRWRYPTRRGVG